MKTITIANIDIDIHNGPIGISCSGGADSSLLLYILMKHAPGPIHVFTCALDIKKRSTLRSAPDVLNKIIDLTGNYNVYHHFHFIKDDKNIDNVFKQQVEFLKKEIIIRLYTGFTQNPPFDIQESFNEPSTENHERNPLIIKPVYSDEYPRMYAPFSNVNKKVIAQIYTELGIMDDLFPVTRSCESLEQSTGHCGNCWWCQERMWGFNRLT